MEDTIKPGDAVTCDRHPLRGPGTATLVQANKGMVFIVWGEFGDMENREYANVPITEVKKYKDEPTRKRKRIPIKKGRPTV